MAHTLANQPQHTGSLKQLLQAYNTPTHTMHATPLYKAARMRNHQASCSCGRLLSPGFLFPPTLILSFSVLSVWHMCTMLQISKYKLGGGGGHHSRPKQSKTNWLAKTEQDKLIGQNRARQTDWPKQSKTNWLAKTEQDKLIGQNRARQTDWPKQSKTNWLAKTEQDKLIGSAAGRHARVNQKTLIYNPHSHHHHRRGPLACADEGWGGGLLTVVAGRASESHWVAVLRPVLPRTCVPASKGLASPSAGRTCRRPSRRHRRRAIFRTSSWLHRNATGRDTLWWPWRYPCAGRSWSRNGNHHVWSEHEAKENQREKASTHTDRKDWLDTAADKRTTRGQRATYNAVSAVLRGECLLDTLDQHGVHLLVTVIVDEHTVDVENDKVVQMEQNIGDCLPRSDASRLYRL